MKDAKQVQTPVLSGRMLFVASQAQGGAYQSISDAAQNASEGDQIIVAEGLYSPSLTGERFPIYLPPHCNLIGAGADKCILDGEEQTTILVRPLDPSQSLIIMGNNTSISQMTLRNSGSNALSNEVGASILITDCILRDNGQHGLLVFAPECAVIRHNQFLNNGTAQQSYTPPRPTPGRQGHQIFIESRPNVANRVVIIGNTMQKTYADGIAIDVFDQPTGIKMWVEVIDNQISGCGRNGMSLAASFSSWDADVFLDIRQNTFTENEGNAIDSQGAFSLILRTVKYAKLRMNIIHNTIDGANDAINVFGAFSPAEDSAVQCNIIGNTIRNAQQYGIRVIGGVGMDGWACNTGIVHTVIANNRLDTASIKATPIFVQGGVAQNHETVLENVVYTQIVNNQVSNADDIIVNDGLETNSVSIVEGSQDLRRVHGVVPYRA